MFSRDRKIHCVTLAEFVTATEDKAMNEHGLQKNLTQRFRIVCGEFQGTPKHAGLVPSDRMRRVETVICELAVVGECVFGVWKKHVCIVARKASARRFECVPLSGI